MRKYIYSILALVFLIGCTSQLYSGVLDEGEAVNDTERNRTVIGNETEIKEVVTDVSRDIQDVSDTLQELDTSIA